MTPAPPYLRHAELVVNAFGCWPGFHDAPVMDCHYDRAGRGTVELTVHAWETTREVAQGGACKRIKHHLVRFAFHGITMADLDRFNSMGNILFRLSFSTAEEFGANGSFRVRLDSALGAELGGSFSARSGEVMDVVPCDVGGRSTAAAGMPRSRGSSVRDLPPPGRSSPADSPIL